MVVENPENNTRTWVYTCQVFMKCVSVGCCVTVSCRERKCNAHVTPLGAQGVFHFGTLVKQPVQCPDLRPRQLQLGGPPKCLATKTCTSKGGYPASNKSSNAEKNRKSQHSSEFFHFFYLKDLDRANQIGPRSETAMLLLRVVLLPWASTSTSRPWVEQWENAELNKCMLWRCWAVLKILHNIINMPFLPRLFCCLCSLSPLAPTFVPMAQESMESL